ncbi:thioredoxin family protein [Sphingomicrobium sediminis]|uniref:Thioredoxin family protein n=1 Tax=Sphingomicrobium sediminis TaxID=2950949 RepID=A0A9X2J0R7_9SPHN|nr:thioredoxin family protein [Sphingomicrobium sediminis]MCM8556538.1 thioredoxin family protein [Sphingomicrobium sediminis]
MRIIPLAATAAALAACTTETPAADTTDSYAMLLEADADRAAKDVPAAWTDFTGAAFAEAQAEGRTVIVDVYADWCPTCKAQAPILDELAEEEALDDALLLKVDYDRDKDFVRALRIPRQSTVLRFENGEEVQRSVAETDPMRLRDVVLGDAA